MRSVNILGKNSRFSGRRALSFICAVIFSLSLISELGSLSPANAATAAPEKSHILNPNSSSSVRITRGSLDKLTAVKTVLNYTPMTYEWSLDDFYPDSIPEEIRDRNPAECKLTRVFIDAKYYADGSAELAGGKLILPLMSCDTEVEQNIGAITMTQTFDNYETRTCVINIETVNKEDSPITGVTAMGDTAYTGSGVRGFMGEPQSGHEGEYDITYFGRKNTQYDRTAEMPVNIGDYSVEIRIPAGDEKYSGISLSAITGDILEVIAICSAKITFQILITLCYNP